MQYSSSAWGHFRGSKTIDPHWEKIVTGTVAKVEEHPGVEFGQHFSRDGTARQSALSCPNAVLVSIASTGRRGR